MLLQNITRNNQYPYRRRGATATNTETGYMISHHGSGGPRQFQRFMSFSKGAGFPSGYNPGLFMPLKHSWISSRQEAVCTIGMAGSALMGLPTSGSIILSFSGTADILPLDDTPMNNIGTASFNISFANADGQLITSGSGTSLFSITCNTPLMTASLNGAGASTFSIYTDSVLLSGEASIAANGVMLFSASADILPEDDNSPLRIASTTFSFGGSLTAYAIGHMEGTTDVHTEVTADSLASALWNADAASYNTSGTMGNKLNTASSGGVDMDALAEAVRIELESTTIPVNTKKINDVPVGGTGTELDPWGPA